MAIHFDDYHIRFGARNAPCHLPSILFEVSASGISSTRSSRAVEGRHTLVQTTMSLRFSTFSPVVLLFVLWISVAVRAYLPATPTNDTEGAIQNGFNVTGVSTLSLLWYENGCDLSLHLLSVGGIPNFNRPSVVCRGDNTYSINVSYDLAGVGSTGITRVGRGAPQTFYPLAEMIHRVHSCISARGTLRITRVCGPAFRRTIRSSCLPCQSPAITPRIALISCDGNSTDASGINNTFDLARNRGAVAAVGSVSIAFVLPVAHSASIQLLYSTYSVLCIVNKEYADPANFYPPFDVFSTQSLITARSVVDTPISPDRRINA